MCQASNRACWGRGRAVNRDTVRAEGARCGLSASAVTRSSVLLLFAF
jgi:hypothetical protein